MAQPAPAPDANRLPTPGVITLGNVPPSDLDAEGAILSWVILEPGDYDRAVAMGLQEAHFYADANRRIWGAITRLSESKQYIDVVEIAGDLRLQGRLEQIGGTPYLARLADTIPVEGKPGLLEQYCRTVIQHWRARQVIALCQTTGATLYHTGGIPSQQIIVEHETQIWELTHDNREAVYEPAGTIAGRALHELAEALRNGGQLGLTTGFSDLDKKTGGYQSGHLVVIAGRTGQGKSALATSSLRRATRLPKGGGLADAAYLHSLEMSKEEVSLRIVCSEANVEFQKMRDNQLTARDWDALFQAAAAVALQPILIGDKPGLTVNEFRSIIRKIKRDIERGLIQARKLAVSAVDYLQLMTGEKGGGRELEVSSITRNLKETAKSEKVCVLALAQVNRESEKKVTDHRPRLDQLRESGAIENDADAVWFVYREKYYTKDASDEAEIIIAKQRGGATGTVLLAFDGPTISFKPLARGYDELGDFADPGGGDMPEEEYWNR